MLNILDIIKQFKPISKFQRLQLIVKQSYLSATDYHNGQHYASLTDLTSISALTQIQRKMLKNQTGRKILQQKPRVRNQLIDKLKDYPQNTFGKAYFNFISNNNFKPQQRPLVNYIPDIQLAYISQRYKQIHDFNHVLIEDVVTVKNQLIIKWFEMIQMGFPSAALASLITPILAQDTSLSEIAMVCRKAQKCKFIMNIYFQKHFDQDLNQFRKEINII